mmetsp:Transcript_14918/g.37587  ORF Transcript_14918/g.37587 Transcript_14918/m.37587 type:complete len:95 (+) Transcript_14918:1571-1855(+)
MCEVEILRFIAGISCEDSFRTKFLALRLETQPEVDGVKEVCFNVGDRFGALDIHAFREDRREGCSRPLLLWRVTFVGEERKSISLTLRSPSVWS